jgi:F0F1-type ATP synthase assembly protein I
MPDPENESPSHEESSDPLSKLEAEAEAARRKLDAVDDDFDARLKRFEEVSTPILERRKAAKHQEAKTTRSDREASKGLGVGLMAAYTLMGTPIGCALIGYLADRAAGTDRLYTGLGAVIGMVLGLVGMLFVLKKFEDR